MDSVAPILGLRPAGKDDNTSSPDQNVFTDAVLARVGHAVLAPSPSPLLRAQNIAPQLIGKQGQTVSKLMKESRAKIVVKPYPDRSGNDVVITGTPNAVKVSKSRVLGSTLDCCRGCVRVRCLAIPLYFQAVVVGRCDGVGAGCFVVVVNALSLRHPLQCTRRVTMRVEEEFYRSKGCQPTALPPPSSAVAAARKAEGARARPAQPVTGGPGGGGGGGAAPVVVEDGAWGGELRQLLRVAGCEHHLERFREDQLDGEVLLMMDRRDFERMGVTVGEQIRILNALKGSGAGGVDDSDEDSDGLDPDHPDTCKICLDALVDILFLPCAHHCTCSRCGSAYEGKPCILCRRVVDKVQRVIKLRG
ncbi:unnamed protein product [Ectocarpus sp. CCAP 1310/34]|nr:unnamed protein product [Ectocarpus sp. CCAP 1310/34]